MLVWGLKEYDCFQYICLNWNIAGVSENVLETWQKNNHTFKKTEYTMKLEVAAKTFFGSANTKKAAKTAVATEAWNQIRTGM